MAFMRHIGINIKEEEGEDVLASVMSGAVSSDHGARMPQWERSI